MAELILNFKTCPICETMIEQLKDNSNWVNQIEKDHSTSQFFLHISKGHKSAFVSVIKKLNV